MSGSFGKSKNKSSSAPLTAQQVASYFGQIDDLSDGRLDAYAAQGTSPTQYNAVTPDQIKNLGGLGATRLAAIERERANARGEVAADPGLSTYQKIRANQMTDEDLRSRLDAINKETEAAITGTAQTEALRKYEAARANNSLRREDLEALANIFFGGTGQTSSSKGRAFSISGGVGGT